MQKVVVNEPATLNVFVKQIAFATDWSKPAAAPPNVTCIPVLAVAARPGASKKPLPIIEALLPPGAPVAVTVQRLRRNQGPEPAEAGTVWAIEAPSVVPAAFEVVMLGLIVSAPVAAVVISPPASTT